MTPFQRPICVSIRLRWLYPGHLPGHAAVAADLGNMAIPNGWIPRRLRADHCVLSRATDQSIKGSTGSVFRLEWMLNGVRTVLRRVDGPIGCGG